MCSSLETLSRSLLPETSIYQMTVSTCEKGRSPHRTTSPLQLRSTRDLLPNVPIYSSPARAGKKGKYPPGPARRTARGPAQDMTSRVLKSLEATRTSRQVHLRGLLLNVILSTVEFVLRYDGLHATVSVTHRALRFAIKMDRIKPVAKPFIRRQEVAS